MATDTRLDWLWKENAQREKKRQMDALKDGARAIARGRPKPRRRELKTLDKSLITAREVSLWERYPLLRRRLYSWPNVLLTQVIDKFGESPICYLTGLPIDYTNTETYHIDHVNPRSKGGASDIDNMQLVNPVVNMLKSDYPLEEFLHLCRLIAARHPAP